MTRYGWTQPQCSTCFTKTHPGREPVQAKMPDLERCVTCAAPTQDGIYVRVNPDDPNEAPFPSMTKD